MLVQWARRGFREHFGAQETRIDLDQGGARPIAHYLLSLPASPTHHAFRLVWKWPILPVFNRSLRHTRRQFGLYMRILS